MYDRGPVYGRPCRPRRPPNPPRCRTIPRPTTARRRARVRRRPGSSPNASGSAATSCCCRSASAVWGSCSRPTTGSSITRSRSSWSARTGPTPIRRRGSSARAERSPGSRTPTSSPADADASAPGRLPRGDEAAAAPWRRHHPRGRARLARARARLHRDVLRLHPRHARRPHAALRDDRDDRRRGALELVSAAKYTCNGALGTDNRGFMSSRGILEDGAEAAGRGSIPRAPSPSSPGRISAIRSTLSRRRSACASTGP